MQKFSYHTHSNYSDGRNSLEEMIQRAAELNMEEFGISDHLVVHKNFSLSPSWEILQGLNASFIYRTDWDEAIAHFQNYHQEIRQLENKYNLRIYAGAEVDYYDYPGWEEEFLRFRELTKLDFYISGNHFLPFNETILYPDHIDDIIIDTEQQKKLLHDHFELLRKSVESRLFDFIAHVDYMRRLKICRDKDFFAEKMELIEALCRTHTPVEVSTKGIRNSGYCFPAAWMLEEMKKCNIPVLITDDAHQISELAANFDKAEELLQQLDYSQRWRLDKD